MLHLIFQLLMTGAFHLAVSGVESAWASLNVKSSTLGGSVALHLNMF